MLSVRRMSPIKGDQLSYLAAPALTLAAALVASASGATQASFGVWVWPVAILLGISLVVTKPAPPTLLGPSGLLELGARGSIGMAALRLLVIVFVGASVWSRASLTGVVVSAILVALLLLPIRILTERLAEQLAASVSHRNFGKAEFENSKANGLLRLMGSGLAVLVPQALMILTLVLPGSSPAVWLLAGASVVVAVLLAGGLWYLSKTEGREIRLRRIAEFEQDLRSYAPTVALYVGSKDVMNLFWITMWVPVLERLNERCVVIVRSQAQFDLLDDVPVATICVARASDFVDMDFGSIRAALFVSNTASANQFIMHRNLMSAFIGHGDSDKLASSNPFAKVYDEIWLAGEAGADRYRRAEVGVREDQFVYVGRPSLDVIEAQTVRDEVVSEDDFKTVLYAPTWEAWDASQEYTSVHRVGVEMIQALLKCEPPVRIIYKRHPFTGQRLRSVAAAHQEIVRLLQQANAGIESPAKKHIIAGEGDGHLYDWFNEADFLVTDITGVLSDFVASEKPYAVFNFTDQDTASFTREFPTASAGLVYDDSAESLDRMIRYIAEPATYSQGDERRALRTYLHGDPSIPAMEKFQTAVTELVAKAEARIQARESRMN